ncbi:Membrane transporter [Trichostrongylus colubriformis]|uniref:Membrane transporter n=1 Tax=Trichostrongylus colubriformis TaxID=6319 RepID=A0AAN8F5A8_TRICO
MSNKVADATSVAGDSDTTKTPFPLFFILLCTICMAVLYSNILTYHVTITQLHGYGNGSVTDFYNEYDIRKINDFRVNVTIHKHRFLSNPQKEALISVAPLGALISWIPVAGAYNQMGFRRCFVLCAVLALIPSVFVPICTSARTFLLAIVVRVLQGFSLSVFLPYLCKMALFIPVSHIAFPSFIFAYIQIAAFFAFPIFSLMSWSRLGWHSVHYGGCIATAFMFAIFLLINYDEVFKEKAARESTFNALFTYERCRSRIITLRLPFLSIYQDFRIWSVFIAAFGYFTALNLYLTFGATFLNKVVSLPIVSTGLLLAIPPASNIVISFASYVLFSRLANAEVNKMRVFNTLGTVPSGILFAMIGLFDPDRQPASVTTLFIVSSSLFGFSSCGFFRMIQLRSRQHHLFLLANLFLINCVSMFLTSLFNVLIAHNDDYCGLSLCIFNSCTGECISQTKREPRFM